LIKIEQIEDYIFQVELSRIQLLDLVSIITLLVTTVFVTLVNLT